LRSGKRREIRRRRRRWRCGDRGGKRRCRV